MDGLPRLQSRHVAVMRFFQLVADTNDLDARVRGTGAEGRPRRRRRRRPHRILLKEVQLSSMEHAIRHETNVHVEEKPAFYQSLRQRLEEIIEQRRGSAWMRPGSYRS